ncbi:TPA: helix-turn-helix domain-containing protein [Escherichia coli]|nr:helix-turn-helix domain-containing protein [Escherichia coli]HAV9637086.1 helix-turn-helix domain-containing protein [Escherichia coli]HAV9655463.1 helix-turn-helix domain-containing protein [Escherichia coli]HDL9614650.1 helix-turn-helix domain-containing protein [Escherichia coli]
MITIQVPYSEYNITLEVPNNITSVESLILKMLMQGMVVKDIAKTRCRSVKTISYQKAQIYQKLGIRNDITFWLDIQLKYKCIIQKTSNEQQHTLSSEALPESHPGTGWSQGSTFDGGLYQSVCTGYGCHAGSAFHR